MAKDDQPSDLMGYEAMQQDALRGVVRAALKRAASPQGPPGDHHFYISFLTAAPGVSGPEDILGRYPEEMTIVLQNQYWDLAPGETGFSVTLQFNGQPRSLNIPYAAISRFYDPVAHYRLQFSVATDDTPAAVSPKPEKPGDNLIGDGDGEPKIVSLDQFRKK